MNVRILFAAAALALVATPVLGQGNATQQVNTTAPASGGARVGDLTVVEGLTPTRVGGYGIVVGLDGTGDRAFGARQGSPQTVESVVNLLRRFGITVPADQLRLRNVAVVLVTGEVTPFARPGTRFDVDVASLGDATSLRGGVLWTTPLVDAPGAASVASAQGTLMATPLDNRSFSVRGTGSVRVPAGGVLEAAIPHATLGRTFRLALRSPDAGMASKMAAAISEVLGKDAAKVEDPGAIAVTAPEGQEPSAALAAAQAVRVQADGPAVVLMDTRTGLVVGGGDLRVGPASVSLGGVSLTIGADGDAKTAAPAPAVNPAAIPPAANLRALDNPAALRTPPDTATVRAAFGVVSPASSTAPPSGLVRAPAGARVQDVVAALHDAGVNARDIGRVLLALQQTGAIVAQVLVQ